MEVINARNVVLGAGAVGSAAAYHLARCGEPVLLVEQFAIGHNRGSSHGSTRITRHSYADPAYARMMPLAFDAWRLLEADAGQTFYLRTGGVSFGPSDVPYVAQVASSLGSIGVPYRRMSGRDWNSVGSTFRLPDGFDVVFEPDAGILAAARAVDAERALARSTSPDYRLLEKTPIDRIDLESARPTLVGPAIRIEAGRLIVAAGSWTGRLVPALATRLVPTRQAVFHFRPDDPDAYAIGRMPVFIHQGAGDLSAFYGIPDFGGLGVKVARHGGPPTDPDLPDREVAEAEIDPVRGFLRECLPGLADAPLARAEVCLYTVAPEERFHVGPHGGRSDVILASPCSGHGFKFSCLIGSFLASLAIEGRSPIDIDAWRLDA